MCISRNEFTRLVTEHNNLAIHVRKLEESLSPTQGMSKAQFDKQEFDFSTALRMLKDGKRMKRLGWSSPNMWVDLVKLGRHSPYSQKPFFRMFTRDGDRAVWFPAICDLLAEDWVVAE